MKTPSVPFSRIIEPLEPRLAPAGLIAVSVNAAGTLNLATVAGQDGNEQVTIDRLSDGNFQLTPGPGVTLRIKGNDFTTPQMVTGVTGGLIANLGVGDDAVTLSGCFFTKGVMVNLGNGANTFAMTNSTLGGLLSITTGDGNDSISISGTQCAVSAGVMVKLGAGNDTFVSSADQFNLSGGLSVDGGAGNDSLSLGASDGDDVRILGSLKVIGGAGDDTTSLGFTNTTFNVTGSVTLTDASGNETITIAGTRFDAGSLVLQPGIGNNSLACTATDIFLARDFQWVSGAGVDTVNIDGNTFRTGTSLRIDIGAGGGSAELSPTALVNVGTTLQMSSSAVAGTLRDLMVEAPNVIVGGKATLTAGAGDGRATISASESISFGGGATFTSGIGDTSMRIFGLATLCSGGPISMATSSNDGTAEVATACNPSSFINGAVTLKGGWLASLVTGGVVTGAVTLSTAFNAVDEAFAQIACFGSDELHISGPVRMTIPTITGQNGTIRISDVVAEGTATLMGGAGLDRLELDNCDFKNTLIANLGAGNDLFRLEQRSFPGNGTFSRLVTLQGGTGADAFFIGGNDAGNQVINFFNSIVVDGGADTDTLSVGTQVTFAPGFSLQQKNIP